MGKSLAVLPLALGALLLSCTATAMTNNIMLTGYWPNTNEMLRQFSNNPKQNPGGWQGKDWEGRGYNIYSFFPEFPSGTFPVGVGDFTVDYQDTSADWARITAEIDPVAIITFSRGDPGNLWEVETKQRNLVTWVNDYVAPFQPTPSPPDAGYAPNGVRFSSLPTQEIADAVNNAGLGLTAFVDTTGFGGGFLSEFIAYHGVWYRDEHVAPGNKNRCFLAGHIHVGTNVSVNTGILASEVTLRTTLDELDTLVPEPASFVCLTVLLLAAACNRRLRRS
jgi:hypothetical protein